MNRYSMFIDYKALLLRWYRRTPPADLHCNLHQNPSCLLAEIDKPIVEFTWKCKGSRIAKIILKKNKVEELTLPFFKTSYKAIVIKTVQQQLHRMDRQISGINEESKISPYIYSQLISTRVQRHSMGTKQFFQQMVLGQLDIQLQKNEVGPLLYLYHI